MLKLPKQHISLTSTPEVAKLCMPLFHSTDLNFFYFVRLFDDGHCVVLSTDSSWIQHKLEHTFQIAPPIPKKLLQKKLNYLIPQTGRYKKVVLDLQNKFNKYHPFDMIECLDGYCDLYGFALSPLKKNGANFYLNNLDIFEKFKVYFHEKSNPLIHQASQHKILLPQAMRPNFNSKIIAGDDQSQKNTWEQEKQKLLSELKPERYLCYTHDNSTCFITKREMESLQLLSTGRSIKEIANVLGLSPRTVESYLGQVKKKIGRYRKTDLIAFIERNFS